MSGWRSQGLGREYDGLLVRGDEAKEACECRGEINAITAAPRRKISHKKIGCPAGHPILYTSH
jgi:hypothetical protein